MSTIQKLNTFDYDLWDNTKVNGVEYVPGPRGNTNAMNKPNPNIYLEERIKSAILRVVFFEPLDRFEDCYNLTSWIRKTRDFEQSTTKYESNKTVKFVYMPSNKKYDMERRQNEFLMQKRDIIAFATRFGGHRLLNIAHNNYAENFSVPFVNLKETSKSDYVKWLNYLQAVFTGYSLSDAVLASKPPVSSFMEFHDNFKEDFAKIVPVKGRDDLLDTFKYACQQEIQFRVAGDENVPESLHFAIYLNCHDDINTKILTDSKCIKSGWEAWGPFEH